MNEAWISARAGCAVVVTDTECFLLEAGREAPPKPCPPGRLNNLRALASDVVQIDAGLFPFPEVKATLETAWEEQSALDFTLMTLDRKLSRSLRENAARVASQLMETETVRLAVRRRLLSVPLPEEADLEGAPREGVMAELVQEAADNRDLVAIVDQAWDRVFGERYSYRELRPLKEASIVLGGFAAAVWALNAGDECSFQHWIGGLSGSLSEQSIRSSLSRWWATASELYEAEGGKRHPKSSMRFENFVLQFDASSRGGYRVRVLKSPYGEGAVGFSLPSLAPGPLAATGLSRDIGAQSAASSLGDRRPLEIGTELFRSIFQGQVRTLLDKSRSRLEVSPNLGLRLEIKVDPSDAETGVLADLPWELLCDAETEDFFALSRQTSLVRYLDVPRSSQPIPFTPPLKILAVDARPRGLPPLDLEAEVRGLEDLNLNAPGSLEVHFLAHASAGVLREALAGDTYNVLHFMGHGTFDLASGEGMLAFEDVGGALDLVSGKAFATKLRDLRSLGVVILNACSTARARHEQGANPFRGVATALVLAGVPAVVAMQQPISDRAAIGFSAAFYRHLARGDSIDVALTEGRQAIHSAKPEGFEWATPVLFLRMQEGEVFVAKAA